MERLRLARQRRCHLVLAGLMGLSGLAPISRSARAGGPATGGVRDALSAAGVRLAWEAEIPLGLLNRLQKCYLVDEYLYAGTTDGKVRAFRADTGDRLWGQPMLEPLSELRPPTAYRAPDVYGVVFTLPAKVLFLDPKTGLPLLRQEKDAEGQTVTREVGPIRMGSGSINSVALSADDIFQPAPRKRIRDYIISRNLPGWQVAMPSEIQLTPLYLPERNLLVMADDKGSVAALDLSSSERATKFSVNVRGRPVGWLAADENAVYLSTDEPRLHVLDLNTGEERLEGYEGGYILPASPVGGPVVTADSVYQATDGGGVQRVGKELKWPNWLARDARTFLAEWPGRVALLQKDGKVAFVRTENGEPQAVIDPGPGFDGISNPRNDAIFLTSARGTIRCYRPAGAPPLQVADFRPVAAQPASQPTAVAAVAAAPAEEPAEAAPSPEPTAEEATASAPAPPDKTGPELSPIEALIADPLKSRR